MKTKDIVWSSIVLTMVLLIMTGFLAIEGFPRKTGNEPPLIGMGTERDSANHQTQEIYSVDINPADFVSYANNKYFTLNRGTKFIYESETDEGTEHIEVYVTDETKRVMGVNTVVVWDRVWLNDELVEDTNDWYAQDKYGNVWYFGEDSKEYIDGNVVSTKGSWEAGVDGALPGIIMKANPKIGDIYYEEYYKGEAEDQAEVIALGIDVKVQYGEFANCLATKNWNPLEPGDEEYKYYCPEAGGLVLEVALEDGQIVQLVNIKKDSEQAEIQQAPVEKLKRGITEEEAIRIAQQAVDGRVTDTAIEKKYGKATYVVEINTGRGETDVIIDISTGEILGYEY